jgi:CheY-like chemotaxis protein
VRADSAGEDRGAKFTVTLPLVAAYESGPEEPIQVRTGDLLPRIDYPERLDGVKILVVDDELDTRELLNTMLVKCGAEVTIAASANVALDLVSRHKFDVIVSDIGMPDIDGYELMERIRNSPEETAAKTPAIALTAYARSEERLRALRAGYKMDVPKPGDYAELITVN